MPYPSMRERLAAKRKAEAQRQAKAKSKRKVQPKTEPAPEPKSKPVPTPAAFKKRANAILEEWSRNRALPKPAKSKSKKKGDPPDSFPEDPDDRMVRRTYRLICNLLDANAQTILLDMLKASGRRYKNRHSIDDKPFTQALLLMSWWVEDGGPLLADGSRRKELSDAMAYADRHGVPSRYVNGFIKQAGLNKIAAKLKAEHFEPGFGPTSQKRGTGRSA